MHPPDEVMLSPATRLLWRAPDSVQLELGGRAVVVEGLPVDVLRRVAAPAAPPAAPPPDGPSGAALDTLAEAGYLWPRSARLRRRAARAGDAATGR